MAQPTNTFDGYDSVGNREDLSDIIFNVSPTETPFVSAIGKTKATNLNHEWQVDSLAAAAANANIYGDDVSGDALTATTRRGNRVQLLDKAVTVSDEQIAANPAGRKNELSYQMAKAMKEIKRDLEFNLVGVNNAKVTGTNAVAAEMGSVQAYIFTNDSLGATGASPTGDGTDARTDGTQRAFTEDLFKDVLELVWTEGGDPKLAIMGSFNKRVASGFTGSATRQVDANSKKLYAAVDVYVSDFGETKLVADRFSRSRDVLIIDPEYWKLATYDGLKQKELAKTGHAEKRMLSWYVTLEACNEKSSGGVFDLTTS